MEVVESSGEGGGLDARLLKFGRGGGVVRRRRSGGERIQRREEGLPRGGEEGDIGEGGRWLG